MVLCRLRNYNMGDAANRAAHDAFPDNQVRMTQVMVIKVVRWV